MLKRFNEFCDNAMEVVLADYFPTAIAILVVAIVLSSTVAYGLYRRSDNMTTRTITVHLSEEQNEDGWWWVAATSQTETNPVVVQARSLPDALYEFERMLVADQAVRKELQPKKYITEKSEKYVVVYVLTTTVDVQFDREEQVTGWESSLHHTEGSLQVVQP